MSERPKIRVLPDDLANQIAAGEVVERPASVVKELVENALDAGAGRVDVSIEGGGLGLIEVADDGHGMSFEDASLCLGRHATSKLEMFSDLEQIASFGFRGEALPSIASVSRIFLRTRPNDSEGGVLVRVEAGEIHENTPVASPVGTTVSVRDLFFNVPARRKFLRSSNTESGHVGEVLTDAALGRPDVAFTLVRDGRKVRNFVRVRSRRERVAQIFSGEELNLYQGERGPLSVEAYLLGADKARKGAAGLKIFVNGRPVRDRALAATIAHSYGAALERGRYPRGVVYLSLPGRLVDVNVHPQKTEVRFADPRAVADAIYSVMQRGLSVSTASSEGARKSSVRGLEPSKKRVTPESRPQPLRENSPVSGSRYEKPVAPARAVSSVRTLKVAASEVSPFESKAGPTWKGLRLLGISRQKYLVCEGEDGIYLLDQHAVHERVLLSLVRRDFYSSGIPNQALLFPETISLSAREVSLVENGAEVLKRLGLDVRVRASESVSIHSIPRILGRLGAEALLRQILSELGSLNEHGQEGLFDGTLARLACIEAIPPGENMGREMAESLLRSLAGADFSASCEHERLVLSHLNVSELERKAGRK